MKMIKKMALVAATAATVMAFVSCGGTTGDTGKINKDFELTNDTDTNFMRGYNKTATKHTGGLAKITIEDNAADAGTDGAGVVGYIFGIEENEDKSENFGLVGIRRQKNQNIQYYVSYYQNADVKDNLNKDSDFCDLDGKKANYTDSKCKDVGPQSKIVDLGLTAKAGEPCVVYVMVSATGPETDKKDDGYIHSGKGDGGYCVEIYKEDQYDADKKALIENAKPTVSKIIDTSSTKDEKATQRYCGLYTNVYSKQTLKGRLDLPSKTLIDAAEVVEE